MAITGTHDPAIVVLSVLVASFASYTALDLGGRLEAAKGLAPRVMWLVTAAISMGGGIWAMHFIGMLALIMPVPISYDVGLTILSFVVAVVVTGVGFYLICFDSTSSVRLVLSGIVMGTGIVAMHYTGMAAMQGHDGLGYHGLYVVMSVVIAIVVSTAALWLAFRTTNFWQKVVASFVMGLAISGMHYTAMAGAYFAVHNPTHSIPGSANLNQTKLALAIAGITFVILLLTLAASLVDRRLAISKQREALLRQTLDSIPIMVWHARTDGFAEYLNKRVMDYTGIEPTAHLGNPWQEAVHPEDLSRLRVWWDETIAAGQPAETEVRLKRFDGEYRWFLIRAEPFRDVHGNIAKWYGVNVDIEDRKRADDALRRSEAYLAEAQRISVTGSFGWRVNSGQIIWSEETYRIFEYSSALEPTVELVLQRTHPDDRARVKHAINHAAQDGLPLDIAHRLLMPGGTVKHVKVRAHAMPDQSSGLEYIGAVTDTTAATVAEEALHRAQTELAHAARVATLGELAASIVHEVNQPIAAIVASGGAGLNWLRRKSPDLREVQTSVEAMISDAHRASEVIRRLRVLAKKGDPQKALLDVNEVIGEVLGMVERELLMHRVVVRKEWAKDLPPVLADRIQLQQVIINLVMNAVDAMSPIVDRTRELKLRSERHEPDQVLVTVQDSGVGLDESDLERMFDAFFTTKADGMGMGLPICRSIIRAHGGRLWAARGFPVGATFQFSLPIQDQAENDVRFAPITADGVRC
jgi:PAS domain S-box-containing protein